MRQAVGADYPVILRMGGKDFIPGSNGLEEAQAFAAEAEAAGIDLLNVTGGWHETTVPQLPGDLPRGGLSYLAANVKRAVSIPVAACNRISSPAVAENILAEEKADLIGMARPLLADPELPRKAEADRAELIRPCVACNQGCLVGAFLTGRCAVWPIRCAAGSISWSPAPQAERFWSSAAARPGARAPSGWLSAAMTSPSGSAPGAGRPAEAGRGLPCQGRIQHPDPIL